jgi:hypothetical protein
MRLCLRSFLCVSPFGFGFVNGREKMERFDFDASLTMMERRGKRNQDKRASDVTVEILLWYDVGSCDQS